MERIALLAGLLALMIWAGSAHAETVSLGYKQDTGPYPSVYFFPETLERAESFEVLVSADPIQGLEYGQSIHCRRGSETVSIETSGHLVTPPYSTTILPTISEPDACWISVSAEAPFDEAEAGTIRVEVTGNRRPVPPPPPPPPPPAPYWTQCSLPGWLKSGEAKVHGSIPCSRAKAIASAAWRKPARAGNTVRARGYTCRRSELRGKATIRCTRGLNIIRVTGKLRQR